MKIILDSSDLSYLGVLEVGQCSYRRDLKVVPAALGDDAGLIGAGFLVFDAVDGTG